MHHSVYKHLKAMKIVLIKTTTCSLEQQVNIENLHCNKHVISLMYITLGTSTVRLYENCTSRPLYKFVVSLNNK